MRFSSLPVSMPRYSNGSNAFQSTAASLHHPGCFKADPNYATQNQYVALPNQHDRKMSAEMFETPDRETQP